MQNSILGWCAVLIGLSFVVGCYLLQMDRWRARHGDTTEQKYIPGGKVRIVGGRLDGTIGKILGSLKKECRVHLPSGRVVVLDKTRLEPLRWWKCWRSRKGQDSDD